VQSGSGYPYTNLKLVWNPRFVNPNTDPDFDDFDKSGWNVVAGGAGEYVHHQVCVSSCPKYPNVDGKSARG